MDTSEAVMKADTYRDSPETEPDRGPSLADILAEIGRLNHQLGGRIEKMTAQLEPVLLASRPTEARSSFDPNSSFSPLGNEIAYQAQQLRDRLDMLDDLSSRLQL